ncbi:hypothetical protein D6029_16790 [Buttiauxella izardii]|uniref:Uncharacterized protein n=1 Tax=Buttiauxella izardii TaxID=82991 RepID=A0A3A5JTN3_9ENTR|nr:hypothetical protein D6029_16790 [Buttiauxella izardii]
MRAPAFEETPTITLISPRCLCGNASFCTAWQKTIYPPDNAHIFAIMPKSYNLIKTTALIIIFNII